MSKRGHGEGSIRQLKSGAWRWQVMEGRKEDGRPNWVLLKATTKKELLEGIEEYKALKKTGIFKKVPTFTEFSDRWFARHKETLRDSSQSSYSFTLAKLQSYWGDTPINEVTASSIYDMLSYFDKEVGLSTSYVKKLRSMAFQIFKAADADNLVNKNPVSYIKYKLDDSVLYEEMEHSKKDAFTDEEIRVVVECEDTTKWTESFLFMTGSGVRLQELLTLKGNDIAEGGTHIRVYDAVNMHGGVAEIGLTKSIHSIRTVPIPTSLQYIARKWRCYGDQLIFESPKKRGKPLNPGTFRKGFKSFCRRIGIRSLTPHCTRHTYVTKLRENGVDQEIVKALVGHARTGVTEGYNHISMKTLEKEVKKINHLYEEKSANKHSA